MIASHHDLNTAPGSVPGDSDYRTDATAELGVILYFGGATAGDAKVIFEQASAEAAELEQRALPADRELAASLYQEWWF